ncbi:hypothetical protein PHIN3_327 [Sinorhizobium phage phiN3]|uniref:Uncharacterized protein n=1 Tax=Sinorhizobium phage phiN3 TaxID=1647405 RepID=A0A0F6WCS5_9CAUD|nr:hypothetical protein AVT40_gp206 [Sinorhizobium phage phiN3]AKF13590.1 hypothetical protein PHIN3_327 [Sinorhizobium phage phiN3]
MNYRELLKKYMNYVGHELETHCLPFHEEDIFSRDEIEELMHISCEIEEDAEEFEAACQRAQQSFS